MKKLKLKQWVKDTLVVMSLYSIIVLGVILLNARFEYLNQQKNTDSTSYHEPVQTNR